MGTGLKTEFLFKIKTGCNLEFLISESIKSLGSTKKNFDRDKDEENIPKLEPAKNALVHCNLVKYDYRHTSKVLFTFVPNKQFGQLYFS